MSVVLAIETRPFVFGLKIFKALALLFGHGLQDFGSLVFGQALKRVEKLSMLFVHLIRHTKKQLNKCLKNKNNRLSFYM